MDLLEPDELKNGGVASNNTDTDDNYCGAGDNYSENEDNKDEAIISRKGV